ncbi:hypothetical protein ACOMHN_056601 [Nucella lapillus]
MHTVVELRLTPNTASQPPATEVAAVSYRREVVSRRQHNSQINRDIPRAEAHRRHEEQARAVMAFPVMCCVNKKTNKLTWQKAIQISKTVTVPCSDDIPCDVLCKQENEQVDMAESDTDQQDSNSAVQ